MLLSRKASYIIHAKEQPGFDFTYRTLECTKPGLGLKLLLALASNGEQKLSDYIESSIRAYFDILISNLNKNTLQLTIILQHSQSQFATHAALLHAAERRLQVDAVPGVY